jgi:BirA family transcriptional regulator, biotin operon repressor / biotin---[acetyl-CoA-carboxylase] ligase
MTQIFKITPELVTKNLNTKFIGQKVVYYPSLVSTMEQARSEAVWGSPAGTVIITDEQTGGKGRLNRKWITSKGSMAVSIIFRPNIAYVHLMNMFAALSVVNCIQKLTGIKAQIKWPNDVLIREKKICGILIENDIRKNNLNSCIVGIGLNVNMKIKKYTSIASFATSISNETGRNMSKLKVLRQLLIEMDNLYDELSNGDSIFIQWREKLYTLGQKVSINTGSEVYTGTAESVTRHGTLILRQDDGHTVDIVTGDVGM